LNFLFWSHCGIYFLGWVLCCLSYYQREQRAKVWGERLLVLGVVLQLIFIVANYTMMNTLIFSSLSSLLMSLSLLLMLVLFILNFFFPDQIFELVLPPLTIFFLILSVLSSDIPIISQGFLDRSTPFGQFLVVTHGILSMLGYILFGIACLASIFFLYQEKRIKNKTLLLQQGRAPSLGLLDTIIYKMVIAGFLFLTVGLLLGINMSVSSYMGATRISLRQVLPVFTWAVYSILLIHRSTVGIRGRNSAIWSIVGFSVAAISFVYEIALLTQRI